MRAHGRGIWGREVQVKPRDGTDRAAARAITRVNRIRQDHTALQRTHAGFSRHDNPACRFSKSAPATMCSVVANTAALEEHGSRCRGHSRRRDSLTKSGPARRGDVAWSAPATTCARPRAAGPRVLVRADAMDDPLWSDAINTRSTSGRSPTATETARRIYRPPASFPTSGSSASPACGCCRSIRRRSRTTATTSPTTRASTRSTGPSTTSSASSTSPTPAASAC